MISVNENPSSAEAPDGLNNPIPIALSMLSVNSLYDTPPGADVFVDPFLLTLPNFLTFLF